MSRRRRNLIIAFCLLTALLLIHFDRQRRFSTPIQTESAKNERISADFAKYHGQKFKVAKVVDGDTIDIDIPDGGKSTTRLRLLGIDTPETKKPGAAVMYYGIEAYEFVKQAALGRQVTVYLDEVANQRDKYGRVLCYVALADGSFLNEVLVNKGFAYCDLRFQHSYYHKYRSLESQARKAKMGLWAGVKRDDLPGWLKRMKPDLLEE